MYTTKSNFNNYFFFVVAQKTIQIRNLKEHCQKNKKVKNTFNTNIPQVKILDAKKIQKGILYLQSLNEMFYKWVKFVV